MTTAPGPSGDTDAIGFAERVLAMLERGRFTATYKYAVLLALMDLCMEGTGRDGLPPSSVTTRQLAEKVLEAYWPHAVPFDSDGRHVVLLQNASHRKSQAEILSRILRFRSRPEVAAIGSLASARLAAAGPWEQLVHEIEWKLIEMPLPRLQNIGERRDEFLYRIAWDETVEKRRADVRAYQEGDGSRFDNRVLLVGRAAEHLCRLHGVLRPLVQRQWSMMVVQLNRLPDLRLHEHLFGVSRESLARVRPLLRELQGGRCFYCDGPFGGSRDRRHPEVDHFIPWSRHPDNGIENLVAAHARCNQGKRDFLAAARHVGRWTRRNIEAASDLRALADRTRWERDPHRTLGVARSIYLRLPPASLLWEAVNRFVPAEPVLLRSSLAS